MKRDSGKLIIWLGYVIGTITLLVGVFAYEGFERLVMMLIGYLIVILHIIQDDLGVRE